MKFEKSCGTITYYKKDNNVFFLLVNQKIAKYYGFPKGHVEENETEIETALRETFEETGLKVRLFPERRFVIKYRMRGGIIKKVVFFLAEAPNMDTTINEVEIDEIKWVSYGEIYKYVKHTNLRKAFIKLTRCLNIKEKFEK